MFGDWRLKDFDAGAGLAAGAAADAADLADWVPVQAPGDTYLALQAAGRIADPFDGENERACAWVKDREWWWRTTFIAAPPGPGERLRLTFLGLDTFAAVWLNGIVLGRSDNMFRPATFDIGAAVRPGENTLALCFSPTASVVEGRDMPTWSIISDPIKKTKRNFIRKAQFGWGWDWGPTLPTVGIWRPVELTLQRQATLTVVDFTTLAISPARDAARVRIAVAAELFDGAQPAEAEVVLSDPAGRGVVCETLTLAGAGAGRLDVTLANPALWWTPELGAPALHRLEVSLKVAGAVVDGRTLDVGVRTVAIDTSADPEEPGTCFFRFVLNGAPIFARGACWIPASAYVAAVDAARYRGLLEAALDANMNMIRIWGGGVYEHDAFYAECDRLGLLVWQDFMFACAPYPEDDPAFVDNVRAEVAYQVARLRNHASIALWCGNNEGQAVQGFVNSMTKASDPLLGALYYDDIMPAIIAELDPTTPYWPGSPTGGPNANSMRMGDVHSWTVWHGLPPVPDDRAVGRYDLSPAGVAYTRYAEEMGRFISEYGIQASPSLETLRRVLPADQLALGSKGLDHRIKDHPKNKIDAMMTSVTGLPRTLEDYVDFTQITQAEGLKFGIEHFRRRMPHCSGSLIWQFNDCWPGVSWSLIDYYGFGKAGYFYVRRAYAPVMASFKALEDGAVELWVTNDTAAPFADTLSLDLSTFAGGAVWAEAVAVAVGAGESRPVWRGEAGRIAAAADRVLRVRSPADRLFANRQFFAPIKDLDRSRTEPRMVVEPRGPHELAVTVTAAAYAYFVNLQLPFEETRFSDNFFDLGAGEARTIAVRHPVRVLSPSDVTLRCR